MTKFCHYFLRVPFYPVLRIKNKKQTEPSRSVLSQINYFSMICAPNGIKASFASLNCCLPNGMPIMVIQSRPPHIRCSSASGIPETSIQIIFSSNDTAPPPYSTSFLNGKKLTDASLKHCLPIGMPTIVRHQIQPARSQLSPLNTPPNINHKKLPNDDIFIPLSNTNS